MPNTTLHALPYPPQVAAGPGPDVPADIKALADATDAKLTPTSQGAGTPDALSISAGKVGRRHRDTTTGEIYLDIGAAWVLESIMAGTDLRERPAYVMGELGTGKLDASEWVLNGVRRTRDYWLPTPRQNGGGSNQTHIRRTWMRNLSSNVATFFTPFYISRDTINWNQATPIRMRIWRAGEGSDGYAEVLIYGGYSTPIQMKVLKSSGPNALVPILGASTLVSGTIFYSQVYFALPAYASIVMEITHSFTESANLGFTAGGQIYFDGTESAGGTGTSLYGDDTALLTTLPTTNLWNGREILFQNAAMAALGIIWKFRYNANSASAYKWEFVGGARWTEFSNTALFFGNAAYTNLPNAQIVLPAAGDYELDFGAYVQITTANTSAFLRPEATGLVHPGGTPHINAVAWTGGSATNNGNNGNRRMRLSGISGTLLLAGQGPAANAAEGRNYYQSIIPMRIG